MQSLKILLVFAISGMIFQIDKAQAIDEVPHKPAAQEKTEDVKGSIAPATPEQQQQLEQEIHKAHQQKGEAKKPKKKKKNKKESKKPTT